MDHLTVSGLEQMIFIPISPTPPINSTALKLLVDLLYAYIANTIHSPSNISISLSQNDNLRHEANITA